MSITRAQLRTLRDDMQAALDKAGISGFEFSVGSMRYTDVEVTIKVEAKVAGATTRADAALARAMAQHNLKQTSARGDTLTGYNTKARKYPFEYTTKRGARYKTDLMGAKSRFGA